MPLIRTHFPVSFHVVQKKKKTRHITTLSWMKFAMRANCTITMCGGCAERRALEDASARRSLLSRLAAETTERAALAERVAALSRECVEAQAAAEEEGRARRAAETRAAAVGGRIFFVFVFVLFFSIFLIDDDSLGFSASGFSSFPVFVCLIAALTHTIVFFY
jgi:hypothetical protein